MTGAGSGWRLRVVTRDDVFGDTRRLVGRVARALRAAGCVF